MKNLILLRSIPGAGKTTFAKMLVNSFKGQSACYSADDYFYDSEGKYNFDQRYIKEAHSVCQKNTCDVMEFGCETVIVHNTFTTEWEIEPYLMLAKKHGYTVTSLIVENRHGNKSVHNVPENVVLNMKNRFSIKL